MKDFRANSILSSFKRIANKSDSSKYIGKMVGSIKRRIKPNNKYESRVIYTNGDTRSISFSSDECSVEYDEASDKESTTNVTNDSGIITSKDETSLTLQNKKIHFSPENTTVVEIETQRWQPPCYSSTPYKCAARVTEIPRLQKVEIEPLNGLKGEDRNECLTKAVLDDVNIFRGAKEFTRLELVKPTTENNNFVRSSSCRLVDEKFIVNLFESRQSNKWKRKSICVANLPSSIINKPCGMSHGSNSLNHRNDTEPRTQQSKSDEDVMFLKLRKERDVECVKMKQASEVLKAIRKNPNKKWTEELLAERILLEADEKYKLIVNKIRDLNYSDVKIKKLNHSGAITLSNFQYILRPQDAKKSKYTEFFVLTLSHETEFMMSKVTTPNGDNTLVFTENFIFKDLDSNFNIKATVFSIRLRTSSRSIACKLLRKKTKLLCPMSKIYYEDVNTYELEEAKVLRPSFVPCGEINITKDDIGNTSFVVLSVPEGSRLHNAVKFSLAADSLEVKSKRTGFLTLGVPNKHSEILFWERKWCVLNGTQLSIYNYPSEEDFGEPAAVVNLEYCLAPLQTNLRKCLKRRNFLLKTGRPSIIDDTNNIALRRKSNFVLEKYYLSADNNEDFVQWTNEIGSILNCLKDWQKFVFKDDYY